MEPGNRKLEIREQDLEESLNEGYCLRLGIRCGCVSRTGNSKSSN